MKLYYRGVSYEYDSSKLGSRKIGQPQPVRRSGSPYNLKYRGVSYHVNPNSVPKSVPVRRVAYKLIYRGITYLIYKNCPGRS